MLIIRISVFTVLMLILMLGITGMTDAHDPEPERKLENAKIFLDSKEGDVEEEIRKLNKMKSAMNVLIGKWAANQAAIANGVEVTVASAMGTTAIALGAYIAASATPPSAIVAGALTLRVAVKAGMAFSASGSYLAAMEDAINSVDTQLENVEAAIGPVNAVYDLNPAANQNGNVPYNAAYNRYIKTAAINLGRNDPATIDYTINTYDIDYDQLEHVGRSGKHTIAERESFTYEGLPYNYECKGPCGVMYRSPHKAFSDHRVPSCGTGNNVDREYESSSNKYYVPGPYGTIEPRYRLSKSGILKKRTVAHGCGRPYYNCPSVPDTEHELQTCSVSGCTVQYRNCLKHTKDHSSHSTTTETTENEFQQPPPTPAPTPSYHTCGVHETSVSGDHSRITPACGVSSHAGYACQIGSSHTNLQASCTSTDSNGQYCTVTSFYACQTHTHVYPAPPQLVTCARSECHDSVTSRYEHRSTCPNCSSINLWSCDAVGVKWHTQVKTCKRTKNGVSCGQSFTSCSNTNACFYGWKHTGTAHHVN